MLSWNVCEIKKSFKMHFNCAINWTFDFCWKILTVHFRGDKTSCFHFIMQTQNTKLSLSSEMNRFVFILLSSELSTCHLDSPSCNFILCVVFTIYNIYIFFASSVLISVPAEHGSGSHHSHFNCDCMEYWTCILKWEKYIICET